jgi:hypothetical protein
MLQLKVMVTTSVDPALFIARINIPFCSVLNFSCYRCNYYDSSFVGLLHRIIYQMQVLLPYRFMHQVTKNLFYRNTNVEKSLKGYSKVFDIVYLVRHGYYIPIVCII